MGSLKTLAFVGAVAMVAASATTALAADLAPAPLLAPPPPPVMDAGFSGLYLRGDVGVGHMGESTVNSVITNSAFLAPTDWRRDKSNFGNNAFAGVGIGYQFNSFMRADITGEIRSHSGYDSSFSYLDATACPTTIGNRCHDTYRASIRSALVMANGYFDLGTWRGLTPYIGAGVGWGSHKISGLSDMAYPNAAYGFAADKASNKFAWALMAGLGFEVTRNLKMEVGYRYLNMGTINSGTIACDNTSFPCANEMHRFKLQSHDVKVGFRYLLADDVPAPAPVMMPVPAMAPVVRKY